MPNTAIITGASSGIGLELAKIFAAKKNDVLLVARSEDKLKALGDELQKAFGITAHCLALDLSDYNNAQFIFDFCRQKNIKVDYLINNAGFGDFGFFADSNWQKQLQMINLNITALTYLTHLFLPQMISKKYGKIMNVASTAAFQPGPTMAVYFATKAFVLHFSEAINNELEGTGVTVTALCPGATESGFQKAANLEESKMFKDKKIPTSKEVAAFGYDALINGTPVAIHGLKNYLLANSVRFAPRSLVVRIARAITD